MDTQHRDRQGWVTDTRSQPCTSESDQSKNSVIWLIATLRGSIQHKKRAYFVSNLWNRPRHSEWELTEIYSWYSPYWSVPMALSLPYVVVYSFAASAIVGLSISLLTERLSIKQALILAVCTTTGMVIGTIMWAAYLFTDATITVRFNTHNQGIGWYKVRACSLTHLGPINRKIDYVAHFYT